MKENVSGEPWEMRAIREVLHENVKEQRRSRRWRVFFRFVLAIYVAAVFVFVTFGMNNNTEEMIGPDHVAIVDIEGTIAADSASGASADKIIKGLERAFKQENSVAVVLDINSPGGSPVQSAQVYREINRLKEKYPDKPVYAVGSDIMASGAYYIAAAADYIYADPTSLVGSVGVIMGGFGFSDAMEKLGVERRVYTAGDQKSFMDPFSEQNEESVAHVKTLLDDIHEEFISAVKAGRGDRLNGPDSELFNGLIWTGNKAEELGLIDGFGSVREVSLQQLGVDKTVNYSQKPSPFQRIADRISASFAGALVESAGIKWTIQ